MENITFDDLDLIEPLHRTLRKEGYQKPTPIQSSAIPNILSGRDLIGLAQTGTGKTAAFALPTLQLLTKSDERRRPRAPRALILTPTRELAVQIGESFNVYGRNLKLKQTVVFGGVGQGPQDRALSRGVDILVATPGRLLDLMEQRIVYLDHVQILTLDEADRMLDMGFINDVKKIVEAIPTQRQSLFFSATMPHAVKQFASKMLKDPVTVTVNPVSSTAERIDQKVMFVDRHNKDVLLNELLKDETVYRVLVFTRTKHRANKVSDVLNGNKVRAEAIHGNKSQGARQRALRNFISGKIRVLVATDIAARGIDVDGITHVINFELPNEPESYVHRIGRTARAGADGIAISFCDLEERSYLTAIERVIKSSVPVDENHEFHSEEVASASKYSSPPPRGGSRKRNQGWRGANKSSGDARRAAGHGKHHGSQRSGRSANMQRGR
ncbi:ATP-dependent RNA helicase RhlE [hydrothermal vent metagenome]|uniref:ATP-dependent RNA helicase RhlE n=1 Tax=hydrothermal vent metagenome TaxID=652676 RepID=A0A3B1BJ44_9ZZZZ